MCYKRKLESCGEGVCKWVSERRGEFITPSGENDAGSPDDLEEGLEEGVAGRGRPELAQG